jgi:hypothetical protein
VLRPGYRDRNAELEMNRRERSRISAVVASVLLTVAACGPEPAGETHPIRAGMPDSVTVVQLAEAALREERLLEGPSRVHSFVRSDSGVDVTMGSATPQRGGGGVVHVDRELRAAVKLRFQ